nr:HNH endonuclease [Paenibacillus swuensis]
MEEEQLVYKLCTYCNESKMLSEFLRRTGKRSGAGSRRGACRSCRKLRKPGQEIETPSAKIARVEDKLLTEVQRPTVQSALLKTRTALPRPLTEPAELALSRVHELAATRQGIVRMRGRTDKGRRWVQETDLATAVNLVVEHAAVVVNRNTVRRLFSNRSFREYLLKRDRYTCYFCGGYGDTIDHLLPRVKGGHTTPVNCVIACNLCNQIKAARDADEFIRSLAESRIGMMELWLQMNEAREANPDRTLLIGVDGCGGSGKSTLAERIRLAYPDVTVVHHDDFYKPRAQQRPFTPDVAEVGANFDWRRLEAQVLRPATSDRRVQEQGLGKSVAKGPGSVEAVRTGEVQVMGTGRGEVLGTGNGAKPSAGSGEEMNHCAFKAGISRPMRYQRYEWDRDAHAEWITIPQGGIVVVEGVYSLRPELVDYYDLTVWVETPRDLRLQRGLERDGEQALPFWQDWMAEEDLYMERTHPQERVRLVLAGV